MQLNEILEENSVKAISEKTNISENNVETLLAGDFDKLKKVKTLGFISIIEREYKADLSALKEQALSYYDQHEDVEGVTLGLPVAEEKKRKPKWFLLLVLGLLGYAS
jgi:Zn-finger domain-containing protein